MRVKAPDPIPLITDDMYISQKDWMKTIRTEIQNNRQANSIAIKNHSRFTSEVLDLTPAIEKRRTAALLESLKNLDEERKKYAEDWITVNIFTENYSLLQSRGHIMTAAAIWMLDKFTELNVGWDKIFPLLPRDEDEAMNLCVFDVLDSRYDERLIASVEYVLTYRNRDIAPLEDDGGEGYRLITSNLAAKGKDHADVPSRQNFDALMALIPQEVKDKAAEQFEACYKAWVDRVFIGSEYLVKQCAIKRDAVNDLRREMNEMSENLTRKANKIFEARSNLKKSKPPVNVLLKDPSQGIQNILTEDGCDPVFSFLGKKNQVSEPDILTLAKRAEEKSEIHDKVTDEYGDVMINRRRYFYYLVTRGYLTAENVGDFFPEELHDAILKPIPVTDPYELCFALLYLLESGSDIPWLYGSCIGMMAEVVDYLPWGLMEYSVIDDPYWENDVPAVTKAPDFPDWYERKYKHKDDNEYNTRNLAQIVYEATGYIMPRDLHRYDAELKNLGKYGIKQNKAIAMLYCMLAFGNLNHRIEANNLNETYMKWFDHSDDEDEQPDEEETLTPEDWNTQKAELEKQIQKLRASLYNAEKSATDAQKKLEQQKAAAEAEHRELIDLREVIFNRDEEENDEDVEEAVDSSKYPYTIQKSTVVFGGHESWVKSLKPLLKGDIKFIAKEMKIDVSLVRYADVVWIQTNAIPHRSYYSIVNTARKMDKPIRYFTNASAAKCAEQIVENDKRE